MTRRPDRSVARLLGQGVLGALLVLAAIVAYLAVDPAWRPLGVRLGCAAIVVAACVRLRRAAGRALGSNPPSALDAPPPTAPPPALDPRYLRCRDDLRFSRRSRRYFDAILWPRLVALAGGDLRPAAARARGRRGPSLAALEGLIADIERRP